MVEVVPNAISLHSIKKTYSMRLLEYFQHFFGQQATERFLGARRNFVESLAAYSLVCYFLQIKDRHNGNILVDADGHIMHIDFGFFMANSPRNLGFESAPFKLTHEFVEVMGGMERCVRCAQRMLRFRARRCHGRDRRPAVRHCLSAAARWRAPQRYVSVLQNPHAEGLCGRAEAHGKDCPTCGDDGKRCGSLTAVRACGSSVPLTILRGTACGAGSRLACFAGREDVCVNSLRDRFHISLTEDQLFVLVNSMIDSSITSFSTRLYDNYQYYTNGIL